MLGLAAVPAALVMLMLLRMPDTARWYMLKGRTAEARKALQQIEPAADVDRELAEIKRALTEESGGVIREMLRKPYLRATIFVVGLGFFIQITGINAIVYYSPRTLRGNGLPGQLRAARACRLWFRSPRWWRFSSRWFWLTGWAVARSCWAASA